MKKKIIYIVLFTCISLQIQAQDKKEAIKELFKVMKVEKMTSKMMDNILPIMTQQIPNKVKNEEDKAKHKASMDNLLEELKIMSTKMNEIELPLIYEKHFTYEDIINLTNFYKTPSGQKYLAKTPEIGKESMQIMMSKYMPELQKKIKAHFKEFKK